MQKNDMSLSFTLDQFRSYAEEDKNETLRLGSVVSFFQHIGVIFCLLLLAGPMALPIPVPPGINILLASPLILLSLQVTAGKKHIWLPEKVKNWSIKKTTLISTLDILIPKIQKIEKFIKPRLTILSIPPFRNLFGVAALCMALTICIPIPGTNTIPSLGIVIMSAGLVTKDGYIILLGTFIGLLWISILAYVAIHFGPEAVEFAKDIVFSKDYKTYDTN